MTERSTSPKKGDWGRDMRETKQVTVKMTEQFAKDLNLLMASYRLTDVSYVLRESVSAQAEYVRKRITERLAKGETYSKEDET